MDDKEIINELLNKPARKEVDPISGCWLWKGCKRTGYGIIVINRVNHSVHVLSAKVYLGPAPPDKPLVLHKCNNKSCFNPEHLEYGTYTQNLVGAYKDNLRRGRVRSGF